MTIKKKVYSQAVIKAHATGRWAEIIFRALSMRVAKRWRFVSFRGTEGAEWRGIVDVIAIRKCTSQPASKGLKRGDIFDIILIQIKGGSARLPSDSDCERLNEVMEFYHAKCVALFEWRKGKSANFYTLKQKSKWPIVDGVGYSKCRQEKFWKDSNCSILFGDADTAH